MTSWLNYSGLFLLCNFFTVFLMEPCINPSGEIQAAGRIVRSSCGFMSSWYSFSSVNLTSSFSIQLDSTVWVRPNPSTSPSLCTVTALKATRSSCTRRLPMARSSSLRTVSAKMPSTSCSATSSRESFVRAIFLFPLSYWCSDLLYPTMLHCIKIAYFIRPNSTTERRTRNNTKRNNNQESSFLLNSSYVAFSEFNRKQPSLW